VWRKRMLRRRLKMQQLTLTQRTKKSETGKHGPAQMEDNKYS
jgi:hypothetical protein